MKSPCRGLTFAELMVVVVVIGVIATTTLPNLRSAFEITKGRESETTLRIIYEAEWAYYLSNPAGSRRFTASFDDLKLYIPTPPPPPTIPPETDWGYALSTPGGPQNFTATANRKSGYRAGKIRTINQVPPGTIGGDWAP